MKLIALLFVIPIAECSENAEDSIDQMDAWTVVGVVRRVCRQQVEKSTQRINALMAARVLRMWLLLTGRRTDWLALSNDIVDAVHAQLNGGAKEFRDGIVRTKNALNVHLDRKRGEACVFVVR